MKNPALKMYTLFTYYGLHFVKLKKTKIRTEHMCAHMCVTDTQTQDKRNCERILTVSRPG